MPYIIHSLGIARLLFPSSICARIGIIWNRASHFLPYAHEFAWSQVPNQGITFQVIPRAIDLIQSSDRYHRTANPESNILVVGIPNVGKSSLINVLREKNLQITGSIISNFIFCSFCRYVEFGYLITCRSQESEVHSEQERPVRWATSRA